MFFPETSCCSQHGLLTHLTFRSAYPFFSFASCLIVSALVCAFLSSACEGKNFQSGLHHLMVTFNICWNQFLCFPFHLFPANTHPLVSGAFVPDLVLQIPEKS